MPTEYMNEAEYLVRHAALLERVTVLERALEEIVDPLTSAEEAYEIAQAALDG